MSIGDGIGYDCAIVPTKFPDIVMVTTTDFFFPNVDDPYLMGKIACANVLSDLYSFGIDECDNMLMLLAASTDMTPENRNWSTRGLIQGFNDHCNLAGTKVRGGQTVKNPWPLIGGVATAIIRKDEMIMPVNAVPGDVLVLTKPLGTQVCANFHQWIRQPEKWAKIADIATVEEAVETFTYATQSMARLNRIGARLMRKYGAHAATDVTGFGIAGHSDNLAKSQLQPVVFEIHTLPIIEHMKKIDVHLNNNWNLCRGLSAETSGGLLIAMPEDKAREFVKEIEEIEHQPAWIIGRVLASDKPVTENRSVVIDNPTILEIKPNQNFN
ncbi:selenide water dikinase [Heterostelium album PN500]|uniref:Selenide water dikinase n=1 Tax=Heterostelium pallidum (strain ATCC 26659 / Pp 5 / PN500) TaxID=670386 RepID=D3BT59_HETP5|nr:selenide water dikinase [Heterostelium album PN500]EFA75276.1 selenide water dikinase [Heterostelium album PN500]|eukprot:XP_020427410.1 selenide water dikinase [Heterostelium album PN500]